MRRYIKRAPTWLLAMFTLVVLGMAVSAQTPPGLTSLYQFTASIPTGQNPNARLFKAADGNLYGTTQYGGVHSAGTFFKVTPSSGAISTIYSFAGGSLDGGYPLGEAAQDSAGNFYLTTYQGGADGLGAIVKFDTSLNESVVYSFTSQSSGGANPAAG
ncbi:MAG TPA: choice-of-anchor tandem repeat GloVer-containing protein, partial [Chthonomonadales bacterium]|nr:choice-of-anchor tandem repeat GloVer-containing protein [Chthonomonadales bacterium]